MPSAKWNGSDQTSQNAWCCTTLLQSLLAFLDLLKAQRANVTCAATSTGRHSMPRTFWVNLDSCNIFRLHSQPCHGHHMMIVSRSLDTDRHFGWSGVGSLAWAQSQGIVSWDGSRVHIEAKQMCTYYADSCWISLSTGFGFATYTTTAENSLNFTSQKPLPLSLSPLALHCNSLYIGQYCSENPIWLEHIVLEVPDVFTNPHIPSSQPHGAGSDENMNRDFCICIYYA